MEEFRRTERETKEEAVVVKGKKKYQSPGTRCVLVEQLFYLI